MGWGCGLVLCLPGLDCWVSFAPVFSCICCWVLILVSSPFYISICIFYWMMHRWIYLPWFTSEIRVQLATANIFSPSSNFFVDLFCYLNFISVMMYCLFLAALWSPAWKRLTSWLSLRDIFFCFCHFPVWFPESGVAFDCIDPWYLLSFLPCVKHSLLICYSNGNWWLHVRVQQEHRGLASLCTVCKK